MKIAYRTRDFWLASALTATGCRLLRLEWDGPQAWFVFDDESSCEARANQYWQGKLRVSAKGMADALRTLKDRLHLRGDNHGHEQFAQNPRPHHRD